MQEWPIPINACQVQQFLGFASYYCEFIENFADLAEPMQSALRGLKNHTFELNYECSLLFARLKEALCTTLILAFPKDEDCGEHLAEVFFLPLPLRKSR